MGLGKAGTAGPSMGNFVNQIGAMLKETKGPSKLALGQLTEALRTGGVTGKIPLINQAVSASNQQLATNLAQTSDQLRGQNIGGPFAASILAGQRMQGQARTAAIPSEMAQSVISQMMPYMAGIQSAAFGGLGEVAQANLQLKEFNAAQFNRTMSNFSLPGLLGV